MQTSGAFEPSAAYSIRTGPARVLALHDGREIFTIGPRQDFGNIDAAKRSERRIDVERRDRLPDQLRR